MIKKILSYIIIVMVLLISLPFNYSMLTKASDASLKVIVVDKETREPINNAEFKLIKKDDSSKSWTKKTNDKGTFEISVPEGEYKLQEVSVPDPYKVYSDINLTLVGNKSTVQIIENVKKGTTISGSIVFDSTTIKLHVRNETKKSEPIPNAQFLVKGEGVRVIVTTDANGEAQVPGVRAGKYTISQISAPEGFSGVPDDTIVNIPKPNPEKYAEFVNVTVYNSPYDVEKWGTLNIDVFDNKDRSQRVPNAKIKVTDDIGNTYLGTTDDRGHITFRGMSKDRTYKIGIIEVPYDYYLNNFVFVEDVKLDKITNSQTQSLYLPKRTTQLVTFVNFEKGNFDKKIQNSIFKLIHDDGSSRSFQITNSNGELQLNVPEGNYILQQITTDSEHNIITENIPFEVNRPVTINIENTLKDYKNKKTEVKFNKVWEDVPASQKTASIRLYKNGEATDSVIPVSSNDSSEKVFSNLPLYEDDHSKITYSVKEDPIADYYASYEQDKNNPNKWTVKNHEGNLEGTCEPSSMWMSTENTAYRLINGTILTKTVTFPATGSSPEDKTHGYAIAYDQANGYLYGINKNGQLAVMDVTRGENGTHVKTVDLMRNTGNLGYDTLAPKDIGDYHRIVNSAEVTADKKYIMVKMASVPKIYMFRIADILNANSGASISAAKEIDAKHAATRNYYPFSDGDVIQYENGDILYTGHELQHKSTSDVRQKYNFYLLKYNGSVSNGKVVDAASGSYSAPIIVGRLSNHVQVNNVTTGQYNWQTIEGMAYVDGRLYVTSNMTDTRNKTITKRWARLEAGYVGGPVLPTRNTNDNTVFNGAVYPSGDVTKISGSSLTDMTGGNASNCNIKINIRGSKSWLNDKSSDRPSSITVRLYENGNRTEHTREVNASNNWSYSFDNLPKFPTEGETRRAIKYTVKEERIPSGYVTSYDEQGFSIINTLVKGNFSILKTNEDGNQVLKGASFSLLNENESEVIVSSRETDENGSLNFSNLKPGTYWLKEDKAPSGYNKETEKYKVVGTVNNTTKKVDFVITKNNQEVARVGENFVIKNIQPKFPIKIVKVDSKDNSKIKTTSTFAITDENGKVINNQQADLADGEFTFNNGGAGFSPGTYYLKEVKAPDGYEVISELIKVEIFNDGTVALLDNQNSLVSKYGISSTNGNLIELRVKNNRQGFNIKLLKLDKNDDNKKLQGAKFKFFGEDSNTQVGEELITNDQGELVINSLEPKTYYLQETSAPEGYKINDKKYKLNIEADGKLRVENGDDKFVVGELEGNVINVKFKNDKEYPIIIQKVKKDSENSDVVSALNGARLKMKSKDGTSSPKFKDFDTYKDRNEAVINDDGSLEWTTSENGNVEFKLSVGEYVVEELKAPDGYNKISQFEFAVSSDGTIKLGNRKITDKISVEVKDDIQSIKIEDKKSMEFFFNKIDNENTRITSGKLTVQIEGLNIFNGKDEKTYDLSKDYVENKGLRIEVLDSVASGNYILTEKSAPTGYKKTKTRYHININQEMRIITLEKTDTGVGTKERVINKIIYRENGNGNTTINLFDIINERASYPSTGGYGAYIFIIPGVLLVIVSSRKMFKDKEVKNKE